MCNQKECHGDCKTCLRLDKNNCKERKKKEKEEKKKKEHKCSCGHCTGNCKKHHK